MFSAMSRRALSLTAVLALAGCASATGPTPRIIYVTPAPITAPAPTPQIVYVTPVPTPTPPPTSKPTPAASPPTTSVTLRVAHCPATFGGMGTLAAPPPTWDAVLPSDIALDYSFYGVEQTLVLAPKGWECSGLVGADGSYEITIADPSDSHATISVGGAPGAPYGEILSMACPFFSAAAKEARTDFPGIVNCVIPTGEKVLRIDATDIEFIDNPGVAGTGALSGLAYSVYGIVHYDPHFGASQVSCALPPASSNLCKPILDTFIAEPF